MQRSQVDALTDHLKNLVGDKNRLVELLAAVYHTMTYSINLFEVADTTYLLVDKSVEDELQKTLQGYESIRTRDSIMNIMQGQAKYALLPVWILNTTWEGKQYRFAMNGQTGKYTGNMPYDKNGYRKHFILTGLVTAVIVFAALFLFWKFF